jgi:hypothetical protein
VISAALFRDGPPFILTSESFRIKFGRYILT